MNSPVCCFFDSCRLRIRNGSCMEQYSENLDHVIYDLSDGQMLDCVCHISRD